MDKQNEKEKLFLNEKNFYKKFLAEAELQRQDLIKCYSDSTKWTKFIKQLVEEKILGKENICEEYYRIDSLKYDYTNYYNTYQNKNHKEEFTNYKNKSYLYAYNWKNVCAVEYENDRHTWTDELVKLSHIRCNLKVIICYSEYGCENNSIMNTETDNKNHNDYINLINEKLEFAEELLQECEPDSLEDHWLIIFGPSHGQYYWDKIEDKPVSHYFVGFELVNKKFEQIKL